MIICNNKYHNIDDHDTHGHGELLGGAREVRGLRLREEVHTVSFQNFMLVFAA